MVVPFAPGIVWSDLPTMWLLIQLNASAASSVCACADSGSLGNGWTGGEATEEGVFPVSIGSKANVAPSIPAIGHVGGVCL